MASWRSAPPSYTKRRHARWSTNVLAGPLRVLVWSSAAALAAGVRQPGRRALRVAGADGVAASWRSPARRVPLFAEDRRFAPDSFLERPRTPSAGYAEPQLHGSNAVHVELGSESEGEETVEGDEEALKVVDIKRVLRDVTGARIGNVSTLGVGTFGEVFNATVKIGGQAFPVAVKRQWVTSRWTYDAERKKEAVRREITALSALNGTTGFVGYYGSHVADGKAYTFMQIADKDLYDYSTYLYKCRKARRKRPIEEPAEPRARSAEIVGVDEHDEPVVEEVGLPVPPPGFATLDVSCDVVDRVGQSLAMQLLRALAHMEEQGWVHFDVKLENCLVSGDCSTPGNCNLMLTDFAFSCGPQLGKCEKPLGTPEYMAPELWPKVFDSRNPLVPDKADVWSAGMVCFELILGAWPKQLQKAAKEAEKMQNEMGRSRTTELGKFIFKRFNPALDSKLQTAGPWRPLLVSMLQRDPAERVTMREAYAHALQIADAEGLPPLPEQPFPDEVPQELLARLGAEAPSFE